MTATMLQTAIQSAAGPVLTGVLQGLFLTAVLALVLRGIPRTTAALRYMLWGLTFALCLGLPIAEIWHSRGLSAAGAAHAHVLDGRWALALAVLWLTLAAGRSLGLLRSALHLRRLARLATPVDTALAADVNAWTAGFGRKAVLCLSSEVSGPSALGFRHPRILLPTGMLEQLQPAELRQLVLHEMEHLRRRDDWLNLLQKLGLILMPLHPGLLWAERELCLERELACDESVLRRTGTARGYAECLVRLAENRMLRRPLHLALGAWDRRPALVRRVEHILSASRPTASKQRRTLAWNGAVAATLVLGAVTLAHAPQMVQFATVAGAAPASVAAMQAGAPAAFPVPPTAMPVTLRFGRGGIAPVAAPFRTVLVKAAVGNGASARPTTNLPVVRQAVATVPSAHPHNGAAQPAAASARVHRTGGPLRRRPFYVAASWTRPAAGDASAVTQDAPVARDLVFSFQTSETFAAVPTNGGWLIIAL